MPWNWRKQGHRWVVILALIVIVLVAGWLRAVTIWPQAVGIDEAPYEDEGVYAAAAQLIVQGKIPYRDFFFAHPPLGPLFFAPAANYHYTNWGSPTTFILLRYAALVYSAATVGLAFLIGWRLWGLLGGLVVGVLLAIDPQMVAWTGRHLMLESPALFLLALAALAYILAQEREQLMVLPFVVAGLSGAAAGGVKMQALVLLLAMMIDLLVRRRLDKLLCLVLGAFLCWIPLGIFLFWQREADPVGQFVWFQLLRPADGLRSLTERVWQVLAAGPLVVIGGVLGFVALSLLLGRVTPITQRTSSASQTSQKVVEAAARPLPSLSGAGWTLLLPWLFFTGLAVFGARSYYAHYSVELSLPLALLAGAIPLAVQRAWSLGGNWRVVGLGLAITASVAGLGFGATSLRQNLERHQDRIYAIVSRYAGDAAQPGEVVFALDAQFPFRAARPPARETNGRLLVDGYGMLLYHGLGIEQLTFSERLGQLFADHGRDPYAVIWREAPQAQLRAAMERSVLVILDAKSDGRLTVETRRWLNEHGRLVEQQERYGIYRIRR